MANVGNAFHPTFANVLLFSPRFFTFFNVFFVFISTFITSMAQRPRYTQLKLFTVYS